MRTKATWLTRLFKRGGKDTKDLEMTQVVDIAQEAEAETEEYPEIEQSRVYLEYDLDFALKGLSTGDYGWSKPVQLPKRYILRNINEFRDRLSAMGVMCAWRDTGHYEWEALLTSLFICDLLQAWQEGKDEADITNLFEKDLTATGGRVFTKEQIKDHILPTFTVTEENEEAIYLVLNFVV